MKFVKVLTVFFLLLVIVFIISGCSGTNELEIVKQDYEEEISRLISQHDSEMAEMEQEFLGQISDLEIELKLLQEDYDDVVNEEKTADDEQATDEESLTDEEQRIVDFYNNENFFMWNTETDSRVKIKVKLTEPLRALPSSEAPYFRTDLTYDAVDMNGNEFEEKVYDGELIYTTIKPSNNPTRWCFVMVDGAVGYVQENNIIEYINVEQNFDTEEYFVGLDLGMTVNQLEEMYPVNTEFVFNKTAVSGFVKVRGREDTLFNAGYNPNTRIVDELHVFSEEFPLISGYKVGDDINEVFSYYDGLFEQVDMDVAVDFGDEYRIYDISNGYWMLIDGEEGHVSSISIVPGDVSYLDLF